MCQPSAISLAAPSQPECPSAPSWLLGILSAPMTLSSELLTLGIYRNRAQKPHLEAHKYCTMEIGLRQHNLEQRHSPEANGARACSQVRGTDRSGPVQDPQSLPSSPTSSSLQVACTERSRWPALPVEPPRTPEGRLSSWPH